MNRLMKNKLGRCFFLFCFGCLLLSGEPLVLAEEKPDSMVHQVQGWYDKLSDFQADFSQKTFSQTLKTTSEARGKMYFKKPNLIKWEYESPEKQIYIINKDDYWWYLPEDAQVVKRKANQVLKDTTPLTFLAGMGKMEESFLVSRPNDRGLETKSTGGAILLDLTPKNEQIHMKHMQLKVDAKSFQVIGIILEDPYGNTNDIEFNHSILNQGLPEKLFQFIPPEGVDILDEDAEDIRNLHEPSGN